MSKSLFVGDLSYTCTKETLIGLFSKYGTVKNAHIVNGRPELSSNPKNCASLGYGFVEMASQDEAETAMMELNQSLFLGRFLRVKWAQKNSSEGSYPLLTKDIINSVHVRFKTVDTKAPPVTEMSLRWLFAHFGSIDDVSIKDSTIHGQKQRGYGFVHFSLDEDGRLAALNAAEKMNENVVDGMRYKCETSNNLRKQFHSSTAPEIMGSSPTGSCDKLNFHSIDPARFIKPKQARSLKFPPNLLHEEGISCLQDSKKIIAFTHATGMTHAASKRRTQSAQPAHCSNVTNREPYQYTQQINSVPQPFHTTARSSMVSQPHFTGQHYWVVQQPPNLVQMCPDTANQTVAPAVYYAVDTPLEGRACAPGIPNMHYPDVQAAAQMLSHLAQSFVPFYTTATASTIPDPKPSTQEQSFVPYAESYVAEPRFSKSLSSMNSASHQGIQLAMEKVVNKQAFPQGVFEEKEGLPYNCESSDSELESDSISVTPSGIMGGSCACLYTNTNTDEAASCCYIHGDGGGHTHEHQQQQQYYHHDKEDEEEEEEEEERYADEKTLSDKNKSPSRSLVIDIPDNYYAQEDYEALAQHAQAYADSQAFDPALVHNLSAYSSPFSSFSSSSPCSFSSQVPASAVPTYTHSVHGHPFPSAYAAPAAVPCNDGYMHVTPVSAPAPVARIGGDMTGSCAYFVQSSGHMSGAMTMVPVNHSPMAMRFDYGAGPAMMTVMQHQQQGHAYYYPQQQQQQHQHQHQQIHYQPPAMQYVRMVHGSQ